MPGHSQEDYQRDIHKLWKSIHPDAPISRSAMRLINTLVNDMLDKVSDEIDILNADRSEIHPSDVLAATREVSGGRLSEDEIKDAIKAIEEFERPW